MKIIVCHGSGRIVMGTELEFDQSAADMDELMELSAGGVLTIDLNALVHNYRILVRQAYPAKVSAVVKANAYGIGVDIIAPPLYRAGARMFFVAQANEAIELQTILPSDAQIAVLNDIQPGFAPIAAERGILPVLNSLDSILEWQALCKKLDKKLPALLQLDTGMSRLGLDELEFEILADNPEIFEYADIKFIISHLACADEPENLANFDQLNRMKAMLERLPKTPVALANSGGVFLGPDFRFQLVRPGLALYGIDPMGETGKFLRPVVSLEACVIQQRLVGEGVRVGYGGTYVTKRPSRLATIAVGYADGWHRCLGDKSAAYFSGIRLPIIGRVSMDSMTIDITDLPEGKLKRGDYVELIGKHQTIDEVAKDAGTIPYEILTSLGRRYERRYISN